MCYLYLVLTLFKVKTVPLNLKKIIKLNNLNTRPLTSNFCGQVDEKLTIKFMWPYRDSCLLNNNYLKWSFENLHTVTLYVLNKNAMSSFKTKVVKSWYHGSFNH